MKFLTTTAMVFAAGAAFANCDEVSLRGRRLDRHHGYDRGNHDRA